MRLLDLIPDASDAVSMAPSDLAGYVLEVAVSTGGKIHYPGISMQVRDEYITVANQRVPELDDAVCEAVNWLMANGLVAAMPDHRFDGWCRVTRLGNKVRTAGGLQTFIASSELPPTFLHADIVGSPRAQFQRSNFDTAVFEAFKALEVRVREAAHLGQDLVGVALMQRAFNPEDGRLTDLTAEKGERVALMNLMAGAVGSYKNPHSHRHVALGPTEARDLLILASHLLKIVDARSKD